jgi:hypothetical protein
VTQDLSTGGVHRARDTKLDRKVAVKVLPPALAHDRDRLARFEPYCKPEHSPRSLMKANWVRGDYITAMNQGQLHFTTEQAQMLANR